MIIREMQEEDAVFVAELENSIFNMNTKPGSLADECRRDNSVYVVACEGDSIIGYCTIIASFETADLCNIAVKEDYRKQHIAEMIFEYAVKKCRAKSVERILLEVRESNIPAICFYDKMDFEKIGMRKNYYSNPSENALILQKDI